MSLWVAVALGTLLAASLDASVARRLPPFPAGTTFAAVLRSPTDVPLLLQALAPEHPTLAAAQDRLRRSTGFAPETIWALLGVRHAMLLEGGTGDDPSLTLLWQGEGAADPHALLPVLARAVLPGTRAIRLSDGTITRTTRSDASTVDTKGDFALKTSDYSLNLRKIGPWWILTTDDAIFQGGTANILAETKEIPGVLTMRATVGGCVGNTIITNPFFFLPQFFFEFKGNQRDSPLSTCWGKR